MESINPSSWGRLTFDEHQVHELSRHNVTEQLKCQIKAIPYGMGRSYGDVCLNPNQILWKTTNLNRFISFDNKTGRLVCEGGVLLRDIQACFIPNGWMLPVTPGTKFVTLGGAIANDVHGKNHHLNSSFGNHILKLKLARTNGEVIECGPNLLPDWFEATVGGIGLTGIIIEAEIQLMPVCGPWLMAETLAFESLDEFFQISSESEMTWQYTVSWVDCLQQKNTRGLFMRANHSNSQDVVVHNKPKLSLPFSPPISLVNSCSIKLFNNIYFNLNKHKKMCTKVHYDDFFYPLDHILGWNKIYGKKGFFQYQTVIPYNNAFFSIKSIFEEIAKFNQGSFLSVLKIFGETPSLGMLSFPMRGVTLALDFPNKEFKTEKLFSRLDAIVEEAGGRNYLAKDARMSRDFFERGYPHLNNFLLYRDKGISSAMSRRLMGD